MRWCVGPECHRIAIIPPPLSSFLVRGGGCGREDDGARVVVCKEGCGAQFCFRCGEAPHSGPCRAPEFLRDQVNKVNTTTTARRTTEIQESAKNGLICTCPKCKIPIQKTGGCNHMTCKCGAHFCFLCKVDISRNWSHYCGELRQERVNDTVQEPVQLPVKFAAADLDYVCKALKKEIVDNGINSHQDRTEIEKMLLRQQERKTFAHYYTRFVAHDQGQIFAEGQCECIRNRADTFSRCSDIRSAANTDFFFVANQRLVEARRMLKYSYCHIYYLRGGSDRPHQREDEEGNCTVLLLMHQARLEQVTERLSEVSEQALTMDDRKNVVDLIHLVNRCMIALTNFEYEGFSFPSALAS